jgi:hypothetical protein
VGDKVPVSGAIAFLAIVRCVFEKGALADALFGEGEAGLVSNWERLDEGKKQECAVIAAKVLKMYNVFTEKLKGCDDQDLWIPELDAINVCKLISRVQLNSFTIVDHYQDSCGVGLYGISANKDVKPLLSKLNHSCDPSCMISFPGIAPENLMDHEISKPHSILLGNGPLAILTPLRELNEGEELSISYLDLCSSYQERQLYLKSNYYFDCSCRKCLSFVESNGFSENGRTHFRCQGSSNGSCEGIIIDSNGVAVLIDKKTIISSEVVSCFENLFCNACSCPVESTKLQSQYRALLSFVKNPRKMLEESDTLFSLVNSVLHKNNGYKLLSKLSLFAIDEQKWEIATQAVAFMLERALEFYGGKSVNVGILWLKYSRILDINGHLNKKRIKSALENAAKILIKCYGNDNDLVRTLRCDLSAFN